MSIANVQASLEGVDVSTSVAGCLNSGPALVGGLPLRCPGFAGILLATLGPGTHVFSAR